MHNGRQRDVPAGFQKLPHVDLLVQCLNVCLVVHDNHCLKQVEIPLSRMIFPGHPADLQFMARRGVMSGWDTR